MLMLKALLTFSCCACAMPIHIYLLILVLMLSLSYTCFISRLMLMFVFLCLYMFLFTFLSSYLGFYYLNLYAHPMFKLVFFCAYAQASFFLSLCLFLCLPPSYVYVYSYLCLSNVYAIFMLMAIFIMPIYFLGYDYVVSICFYL